MSNNELRDSIAMAALTGLAHSGNWTIEGMAKQAYAIADAMLAARESRQ